MVAIANAITAEALLWTVMVSNFCKLNINEEGEIDENS
jgi:hypothetical protein